MINTNPFSDSSCDDAGATGDDGAVGDAVGDAVGVDGTDVDAAEVDAAGTAFPPVCPQPVSTVVTAKPSTTSDNLTTERGTPFSFTATIVIGGDRRSLRSFFTIAAGKPRPRRLPVGHQLVCETWRRFFAVKLTFDNANVGHTLRFSR